MTDSTDRTSRTHPGPPVNNTTKETSRKHNSSTFAQRPNKTRKHPRRKMLNYALVTANEG